ncbi:MAG: cbb3-type cytochrome c oxidase subunit 3 [Burkholderiaceae bacterium]|jgi:cytochrome c oxidase cbb3-type subunit 4|nr:cbb3-type cytochrome c oxidase subunit 3 [Burkholderiaceae bacterium]MCU0928514.1 cbb3-type cytochrome c oxidase subunit 3 [Burkholderiaceae bacterium]
MDVNDWRSLVTVAGLVLFLALVAWTWSSKRRSAHDAAARLPFADSEPGAVEASTRAGNDMNKDTNAGDRRE